MATAMLACLLSGCLNGVDYPVSLPTWEPGDWWAFKDGQGQTWTVVALASLGDSSLVARFLGREVEPDTAVELFPIDRTRMSSASTWSSTAMGDEVLGIGRSDAFPLVQFPLQADSTWKTGSSSNVFLAALDISTTAQVDGKGWHKTAGKALSTVVIETKFKEEGHTFGLPRSRQVNYDLEYSPAAHVPVRVFIPPSVSDPSYDWMAPRSRQGTVANLVAWGHGFDLDLATVAARDLKDAGHWETGLPDMVQGVSGTSLAVSWTGSGAVCHPERARLWEGEGLRGTSTVNVVDETPGECAYSAVFLIRAPWVGTMTAERWDGGRLRSLDRINVRLGATTSLDQTCMALPAQPCQIWAGQVGPGEQVWLEGTASLPIWGEQAPNALLRDEAGNVLERQAFGSGVPFLFTTVGTGAPLSVALEVNGLTQVSGTIAVIPAAVATTEAGG